jgi:hypothetical protein
LESTEFDERLKKALSRIRNFPEWMQSILLEDINAAIENRIRTMELIIQANAKTA